MVVDNIYWKENCIFLPLFFTTLGFEKKERFWASFLFSWSVPVLSNKIIKEKITIARGSFKRVEDVRTSDGKRFLCSVDYFRTVWV